MLKWWSSISLERIPFLSPNSSGQNFCQSMPFLTCNVTYLSLLLAMYTLVLAVLELSVTDVNLLLEFSIKISAGYSSRKCLLQCT